MKVLTRSSSQLTDQQRKIGPKRGAFRDLEERLALKEACWSLCSTIIIALNSEYFS